MNKTIMITGANAGIGKETARQLAMTDTTEKVYLACRNKEKAEAAKSELVTQTGRNIFEILIMDVSSVDSVKSAVHSLKTPVDALIMNAGGVGGKTPNKLTKEGVTQLTASNLLGHVALLDALLEAKKLNNVALFASSEAARGIKKMGMKRPDLKEYSVEEFRSIFDGSAFGDKFDAMQVYGWIKYGGTLWMSNMARKYPDLKFVSMSPGGTRGTNGMNDLPFVKRILMKYVGMRVIMPLMGMSHSVEQGAKRFVNGINNNAFKSGLFYASKESVLTGKVIDQREIWSDLGNAAYQENADRAIHSFLA